MDLIGHMIKNRNQMPWDFAENPAKIYYIPKDKIHSEVGDKSDIRLHTDLLTFLGFQCENIVEFGVREGESTIAFLASNPTSLISIDINPTPLTHTLGNLPNWKFILGSSIVPDTNIGEPDLLFLDSEHTYNQVSSELYLHAHKVKKWLVFHDSNSCIEVKLAIEKFLHLHRDKWMPVYESNFNHGLVILQRIADEDNTVCG